MGDIQRDVKKEQLEIDKLLRDLVDRADDFLKNRATIWNVKELWDTGSLAKDFEKQVNSRILLSQRPEEGIKAFHSLIMNMSCPGHWQPWQQGG